MMEPVRLFVLAFVSVLDEMAVDCKAPKAREGAQAGW